MQSLQIIRNKSNLVILFGLSDICLRIFLIQVNITKTNLTEMTETWSPPLFRRGYVCLTRLSSIYQLSLWLVLLIEEIGVSTVNRDNHRPALSDRRTLSHMVVSSISPTTCQTIRQWHRPTLSPKKRKYLSGKEIQINVHVCDAISITN